MPHVDPAHPLAQLLQRDQRYKLDAYLFVLESLAFGQENLGMGAEPAAEDLEASAGQPADAEVGALDQGDELFHQRRGDGAPFPADDVDRTYDLTVEDDTLLALNEQTDARRVALCLRRVVDAADGVELALLGKDAPLSSFSGDLHNEVTPDDV